MFNMFEIASYLPKLEKLASSLTGMELPNAEALKSERRGSPTVKQSRRASKTKKIVLVKKPAIPQTPPMTQIVPQFPQPGMVYVPASWIKKNPTKKRKSVDFSERHTLASLAKRRHTNIEQNVLVQQKPGKNRTGKKRLVLKDKAGTDLALNISAKKAVLALERKRLEFLQYLQLVQEEISALEFASTQTVTKSRPTKNKKRDAVVMKSKTKKGTGSQKVASKPKPKNTGTPKKKLPKAEYSKNSMKPEESNVFKSKQSLTSMLSQDSSSLTQIKMMDDAFNSNHSGFPGVTKHLNESKQTRTNVGVKAVTELPGFFQWNPIPNCRTTNSIIKLS